MKKFLNINIRSLIKPVWNVQNHLSRLGELNRSAQKNVRKKEDQRKDHKHLNCVNSVALSSGQSTVSKLNSVVTSVRLRLKLQAVNVQGKQFHKLQVPREKLHITYKQEKLLDQIYANNVGLKAKSKPHTIIMMNHYEFVGYAGLAIFNGTRHRQKTQHIGLNSKTIVARWEKYTGKKAILLPS